MSSAGVADTPRILYAPVPAADCVELAEDHCFHVAGLDIWIPKGFRWNGASIPWYLWSIIGGRFEPDRLLATARHDWLYLFHSVERKHADALFHRDLKAADLAAWKRIAMYQAVRAFGGSHWPTSEEDQEAIMQVMALLAQREDRDKFTRTMLVG